MENVYDTAHHATSKTQRKCGWQDPLPRLQVTQEELGRAVKWLSRERRMRGEHWWEQGNTGIKDTDSGN